MSTRLVKCDCGECPTCDRREQIRKKKLRRKALPQTIEEAQKGYSRKRMMNGASVFMWPPITVSIAQLDEKFPHLIGAL